MEPEKENDLSSLERTRESLYQSKEVSFERPDLEPEHPRNLRHAWKENVKQRLNVPKEKRLKFSAIFLGFSVLFFLAALGAAGYLLYYGGNSVSIDKIDVTIQGPTTIAGGDTVPLTLAITNRNPAALQNATVNIAFPSSTRSATDVRKAFTRYVENIGTIPSGATVTRSVKAVIFGAAGQTITLPVTFSYGTPNSNAVFQKKSTYALTISSTPLSVSVDSLSETVSGKPLTFTLNVRSNASVPLNNVVLDTSFPFGFTQTSSSIPSSDSSMFIGTLEPGATKQVTITGTLTGQDKEQRVFHFTVGTANSAQDQTLAVTYMVQDATVTIAAPFLSTDLTFNGHPADATVLVPGTLQNVSVPYTNTLATTITNASIRVALSGSAVDYGSVTVANGFYDSSTNTVVFSSNTDPTLTSLAPGVTGAESFTFTTKSTAPTEPTADFTMSVSGARVDQSNVPQQITASIKKSVKMTTAVTGISSASHYAGTQQLPGPIPPQVNQATTYAVQWNLQNTSNAVAGGSVTATLPDYVNWVGTTSGAGSISYDDLSRTVTWNPGDMAPNTSAQGKFQVTLTPSTSQRGVAVTLVNGASFSGYDRFAQVQVNASLPPVTTNITNDPGSPANAGIVQ